MGGHSTSNLFPKSYHGIYGRLGFGALSLTSLIFRKYVLNAQERENMEGNAKNKLIEVLDVLGLALADEGHVWTDKERQLYEESIAILT